MARLAHFVVAASVLFTCGCLVGPNYRRPKVDVPAVHHDPNRSATASAPADSLGNARWWKVFEDAELQKLIRVALDRNFDLRIAASRVLQAREAVTITRSNQYPTVSGGVLLAGSRTPSTSGGAASLINVPEIGFAGVWDIDFWGKYRRLTEAARANLMGAEWARRAVVSGLISNVAAGYFELRELDLVLEVSRRTLASRRDSLQLARTLVEGGAAPLSDQRQAEQLVEVAASAISNLERQIQQQENAINTLLGRNPGEPIDRGRALADQPLPPAPPAGIPSELLERRPDIGQAEQGLIAANARIGVARAAFFPAISLTGIGGVASGSLTTLFRGASRAWNYTGSAMEPIFNKGRLDANYRLAEAERDELLLAYQRAIQQSFREVSDALIAYGKFREYRGHQERLLTAAREAAELSRVRYRGGATSYLEVLTSETNYYSAEVGLAAAILQERLTLVQLYNALGGGWEP
jgi:outer membrane protein, multidrug efflux system